MLAWKCLEEFKESYVFFDSSRMQNFEVLVNWFLCRSFKLCSCSGFLWNFMLALYFFEWLLFCCLILCRSSERYLPWSLWSILTLCRSMRYTSLSYFSVESGIFIFRFWENDNLLFQMLLLCGHMLYSVIHLYCLLHVCLLTASQCHDQS